MEKKYRNTETRSARTAMVRKRVIAPKNTPVSACITADKLKHMCWVRGYSVRDIVAAVGGTVSDWNNWMKQADYLLKEPYRDMLVSPVVRPAYGTSKSAHYKRQKYGKNKMNVRGKMIPKVQPCAGDTEFMTTIRTLKRIEYLLTQKDLDEEKREVLEGSRRRLANAVKRYEERI